MSLTINPETRVGALLEAYPGVEEVLISWVPAFEKLRNPILRKTVAKVATLEQAAKIGGVSVREMVRRLREATGQGPSLDILPDGVGAAPEDRPEWLNEESVRHEIDADSMLKTGVHPIGKVREVTAALQPGELLRLTSSFRPEPLLETMRRAGLDVYCEESSPGSHSTYFRKR